MDEDHYSENLQRYSFTIPRELIESVDDFSNKLRINRSMAVREALSHWVDHNTKSIHLDGVGVAVISYIYDHHDSRILSELMERQHTFDEIVQSSTHVHLSHTYCFEITICKGELQKIKDLANGMRSIKGINSFYINYARSEFGELLG